MNLAEKLTLLRKQKGLTQMDLAERLKVSRQAISRWEVGVTVPRIDILIVLSDLYGTTVDYLVKDDAEVSTSSAAPENVAPGDPKMEPATSARWKTCIIAALLLGILATGFASFSLIHKQETQSATQIENLCVDGEDSLPTVIFPIE